MNKLRADAFLKLCNKLGLVSPRLLSGSVNKGDATKKESTKKKKQRDVCGRGNVFFFLIFIYKSILNPYNWINLTLRDASDGPALQKGGWRERR